MTSQFRNDDPRATRTALVRDCTDALRHRPELRNVGLAVRRQIAVAVVDSVLSVEMDLEGAGR